MHRRPTISEVRHALESLDKVKRPYGDNESDDANSDSVYPYLSQEDKIAVDVAEDLLMRYTRTGDGLENRRSIKTLIKNGFQASLDSDQYESGRLVGSIETSNWSLNISDVSLKDQE